MTPTRHDRKAVYGHKRLLAKHRRLHPAPCRPQGEPLARVWHTNTVILTKASRAGLEKDLGPSTGTVSSQRTGQRDGRAALERASSKQPGERFNCRGWRWDYGYLTTAPTRRCRIAAIYVFSDASGGSAVSCWTNADRVGVLTNNSRDQ